MRGTVLCRPGDDVAPAARRALYEVFAEGRRHERLVANASPVDRAQKKYDLRVVIERDAHRLRDGVHVLVAAAAQVQQHDLIGLHRLREHTSRLVIPAAPSPGAISARFRRDLGAISTLASCIVW